MNYLSIFKRFFQPFKAMLIDQAGDAQTGPVGGEGEGAAQKAPAEGGQGEGPGSGGGEGGGEGEGGAGEGEGAGGEGEGEAGGQGGGEEAGGLGEGEAAGAEAGAGAAGAASYAGHGSPEALVEAFESLKGKAQATEANLSRIRQNLEAAGVTVDREGNFSVQKKDDAPAFKPKFTDEHKALFEEDVLKAINVLVQDELAKWQNSMKQNMTQQQKFVAAKSEANSLMMGIFPQLSRKGEGGKDNAEFNQSFYDRATEIWKAQYSNHAEGELLAAIKAAKELGIPQRQIAKAQQAGYKTGQKARKVVGAVGGSGRSGGNGRPGTFKRLTRQEYLALNPEARAQYKKDEIAARK